ncbi:phytanoyl-CoA dioxygenase family protein [Streptomyces sp. NPDC094038]|uniref:phytanoyl-CoA dioxygenase family protein n=1 Tax=Streptomyces sp. NPDC094038 TaxID=3366055 RepID=UPI003814157F
MNQADFVIPEQDDRELQFVPSDPRRARTLTPAQVEEFNRRGFVRGLPVFEGEEAERAASYIQGLVDDAVSAADQRDSYSVNAYHLTCKGIYELARTPIILDYVEDILGPDFVCWGSTVFCKLPGDAREVSLHQDAAFWPFTPSHTVTAWLSIDGADERNSAMRFVPGSHLSGALAHEDLPLDGTRVHRRQVFDAGNYRDKVLNVLAAGELSLHSDLLLHGSAPNRAAVRRTGLVLRYANTQVRALPGWEWWHGGAIPGRGESPAWWPVRRMPKGEHPELMAAFVRESRLGGG